MSQLTSLRIPNPIFLSIERIAERKRISMTDCILRLIREGLDNEQKAMSNTATDEELIESCKGNGKMIARMIHSSFPNNTELLQDIAELEQLNFSLDQLNEGLNKSPTETYSDWLRSEVLRLEIARYPIEH